ncbi:sensor histidine kinase [Nocardioides lianchengensis]|uniref:histidine kinase n=1 Tax=Nocardioides lianchengensis TaxID=1045774 RepID=A0A1G6JLP8_9ACTN|nr:histidine kinase [Nocardioides lianchengensis]NYG08713.1 signal transduction histidine kinase [Nocardioides lianchengensis]SDC19644.1 Signal transduction histidine kinase [Nocardioides lianchengensis]
MDRPTPEEYQPPLSAWGHTWRLVAMLAISALIWATVLDDQSEALWAVDVALGIASYVLVFFRRRWPVAVAFGTNLLGTFSAIAAGPASLALVSLSTRRVWRHIIPLAVASFASAQVFAVINPPEGSEPWWLTASTNLVFIAAVTAWGMYLGSRRELIWTLRNRAERAEAEQELRSTHARDSERARIAREMHDVLAHRISQISMHAGALAFREDLGPAEMRASAGVIQQTANEALTDLRGVLGVLRDRETGELLHTPQPTYADLAELVEAARATGARIEYDDLIACTEEVPDSVGRTLYRIVQEGITNAGKHAPGALLTIQVSGSPDDGVDIMLRNPVGFGPTRTPGSGLGLVGLAERAELRGGHLSHGRDGSTFVLHAWIPWAS